MTNANIVSLDLSFNVIRADGAEFIAEVCYRFTFNTLRNVTTLNKTTHLILVCAGDKEEQHANQLEFAKQRTWKYRLVFVCNTHVRIRSLFFLSDF